MLVANDLGAQFSTYSFATAPTTGANPPSPQTFNLPTTPPAKAGTVTCTVSNLCTGPAGGASFVVTADGITVLNTSCMTTGSLQGIIPPGTRQVIVTIVVPCNGNVPSIGYTCVIVSNP